MLPQVGWYIVPTGRILGNEGSLNQIAEVVCQVIIIGEGIDVGLHMQLLALERTRSSGRTHH